MGIEYRGTRRYFYSVRRVGGKVVKEYYGGEQLADLAQILSLHERNIREANTHVLQAARKADRERFAVLDSYLDRTRQIVESFVIAAGYHRPKRGEWRKRRETDKVRALQITETGKHITNREMARPYVAATPEGRSLTVRRALAGESRENPAALDAIAAASVEAFPGEWSAKATDELNAVIERLAQSIGTPGQSVGVWRQTLQNDAHELRVYLYGECGGKPSPLDCILIDRVIACRIALTVAERSLPTKGEPGVIAFREKSLDRAHNRFLSAVKTLAQVRRLKLPALAILSNGPTQVNVGTGGSAE